MFEALREFVDERLNGRVPLTKTLDENEQMRRDSNAPIQPRQRGFSRSEERMRSFDPHYLLLFDTKPIH